MRVWLLRCGLVSVDILYSMVAVTQVRTRSGPDGGRW